jgi:hypothetical protein
MPLLDPFHPPLSLQRPWEGIHSTWTATIATQLNRGILPPDYFAMPQITVGVRVEADVTAWKQPVSGGGNGPVATQVWAPPRPALSAAVDFVNVQSFEVQILQQMGGPKLRTVVELISPANKDRPGHRLAFAIKCAAYLQKGISLVVVDVVTERKANLHAQLAEVLPQANSLAWQSPTDLYAVTYRAVPWSEGDRMDVWPEVLTLGAELPTMPLWLDEELCIPLRLEESYATTCDSLRIPT